MGIYGKAAIIAAKELQINKNAHPREVWKKSVSNFTNKKSSIEKGCPQTTFLILCKEGFIKNVSTNFEMKNELFVSQPTTFQKFIYIWLNLKVWLHFHSI